MDKQLDKLYDLLPAIYRQRDADQGQPLRALLQVIAEQVAVVEADISGLYENWFIETCQDWVVPYIGDLVGCGLVQDAGDPTGTGTPEARRHDKILIPRREVANTIRARRRKGTLSLLDDLAWDVAGWSAHVREAHSWLAVALWLKPLRLDPTQADSVTDRAEVFRRNARALPRGRTADLHDGDALDLLDGPFDRIAHHVDVRRRYNIPDVSMFVWRLRSYSVSGTPPLAEDPTDHATPAYCLEEIGPHCYTFSALGHDSRLFTHPPRSGEPAPGSGEFALPLPIRRRALDERFWDNGAVRHQANPALYAPDKSLVVYADRWAGTPAGTPIPPEAVLVADLADWKYRPPRGRIAVDPERGRLVFPPGQLPRQGVRVRYHYGFSSDLGGGEYDRPLPVTPRPDTVTYVVGEQGRFTRIGEALAQFAADKPQDAIIEIADSLIYTEQIAITLGAHQSLWLRAADGKRPILRFLDWQTELPDAFGVSGEAGSRFTMDGLLLTGRAVHVTGDLDEFTIRHCTLVPGWALGCDCSPKRPAEPSLELVDLGARVRIEHSIVGAIVAEQNDPARDPIPLCLSDSILDATSREREAVSGGEGTRAPVRLTVRRATVFGRIDTHVMDLAENSIFTGLVRVARRQTGCVRFCYVPPGSVTPRRYECQPDGVEAAAREDFLGDTDPAAPGELADELAREDHRVQPQFVSERYGASTYGQLRDSCADEIRRGADDRSEMGAFHDLFQPQRAANQRARLDEFTPAGLDAEIFYAT